MRGYVSYSGRIVLQCFVGWVAQWDQRNVQGLAEGLAASHVPEADGAVEASGGEQFAVRAERHGSHRVGVAGEGLANGLALATSHKRAVPSGTCTGNDADRV